MLYFIYFGCTIFFFICLDDGMQTYLKARIDQARAASAWKLNAYAHINLCLWMLTFGEGDLSFVGPFTNKDQQTVNLLAIPLTFLYYFWSRYAMAEDAGRLRFIVPVLFYIIGWFTVWPKFFTIDQYEWPSIVTATWIFIFWSETSAFYYGMKCLLGSD